MALRFARPLALLFGVSMLALALPSCWDPALTPSPPPAPSTAAIGPAGGTLTSADGIVTLEVPKAALTKTVTFGIQPAASAPGGAMRAYELTPTGTTFAVPATLTIDAGALSAPAGTTAADFRIETATGGVWQGLFTSYDGASQTLSAQLAHLSTYGVVALAGAGKLYVGYSASSPIVYDSVGSVDAVTQQPYSYIDQKTVGMTAVSQPDLPTCPFADYVTRPMYAVLDSASWAAAVPPAGATIPARASSSLVVAGGGAAFSSSQVVTAAVNADAPNGTSAHGQHDSGSVPGLIAIVGEKDNPSGAARTVTARWSATGRLAYSSPAGSSTLHSSARVYYRAADGSCHALTGSLYDVNLPVPASGTASVQVPAGATKVWAIMDTDALVDIDGGQGVPASSGHLDVEVQIQVE